MNFGSYFKKFSNEKTKAIGEKVDSNSLYYQLVMKNMASDLRSYIRNDNIIVKPSVGQGNYADIP